ncbi:dimethyl sulfoxide reductase anchor subunit family protein, partial [Acidobacteriota bacterium]
MGGTVWSLMLFTLFIQASVGVFLISEITVGSLARNFKWGSIQPGHVHFHFLSLALCVSGIGISFLHLGSPQNAYHTLNNFHSSWLSREIFFVILFTVLLAVLFLLRWKKALGSSTQRIIAVFACASGLILIFSMSKLYMLPTVPTWNNLGTPLVFFITTLLLGCQIFGLTFNVGVRRLRNLPLESNGFSADWCQKTFGRIILFSLALIVLQLSLSLLFYSRVISSLHVLIAGAP